MVILIIHFDFSLGADPDADADADADASGCAATAAAPPNPCSSELPVEAAAAKLLVICSVVLLIHSSTIFSNSKYCDIISLSCSIRVFISSGSKHISTESTISFKMVSSILGILSLTNSLSISSSFFM